MYMPRQPELPGIPPKPKREYVLLAHVHDAGEGQGEFPYGAMFRCHRCTWESEWLVFDNISEVRRGIACPTCNASKEPKNDA